MGLKLLFVLSWSEKLFAVPSVSPVKPVANGNDPSAHEMEGEMGYGSWQLRPARPGC